jgi:hypothetical protein
MTIAITLFLATLTITILLAILASASRHDLKEDFQVTLTAVFANAPLTYEGDYPFSGDSLIYSAAESCDAHVLTGFVFDLAGNPLDNLIVQVWGDFMAGRQSVRPGNDPAMPGRWRAVLPGVMKRSAWVQLATDGEGDTLRYLSPPVEVLFDEGDCVRTQAEIVFEQVAAVE